MWCLLYTFVSLLCHSGAALSFVSRKSAVSAARNTLKFCTASRTTRDLMTMKVGNRSKSKGGDGLLAIRNQERIRNAGKKGTKRFQDPTKVFLGNLPFDATEESVKEWLLGYVQDNINSIKVIRDWKTGKSKGFGFCQFINPIYATAAIEFCNGKPMGGRPITVSQGRKTIKDADLYIKKKNKKPQTEEEAVIQEGLAEASDDDFLFDDEDDDFEFDGVFEEEYPDQPDDEEDETMNREQRREAAKRRPRRKLSHKGFESQPQWEFSDVETKPQEPIWVVDDSSP